MSENQSGLFGSGENHAASVRRPPEPPRQPPAPPPAAPPHGPQGAREARLAKLSAEVESLEAEAAATEEAALLARKLAAQDRIRQAAPAAPPTPRRP